MLRRSASVHPRSRGEHPPTLASRLTSDGSSPLARGTPSKRIDGRTWRRFIPARAGNTLKGIQDAIALRGSSPLARGTLGKHQSSVLAHRFIPARAGNTAGYAAPRSRGPVHPRSRGEHFAAHGRDTGKRGSSPLARGTPSTPTTWTTWRRFIPARAGNTPTGYAGAVRRAVHPRSRGEHSIIAWVDEITSGSSPLARGTPLRKEANFAKNAVHPRSRGEHRPYRPSTTACCGSSPLARGTPDRSGCPTR